MQKTQHGPLLQLLPAIVQQPLPKTLKTPLNTPQTLAASLPCG
jgi:hypothetical protein